MNQNNNKSSSSSKKKKKEESNQEQKIVLNHNKQMLMPKKSYDVDTGLSCGIGDCSIDDDIVVVACNNDQQNEKRNYLIECIEKLVGSNHSGRGSRCDSLLKSGSNDHTVIKKKERAAHLTSLLKDTFDSVQRINNIRLDEHDTINNSTSNEKMATMIQEHTNRIIDNIVNLCTEYNSVVADKKKVLKEEKKYYLEKIKTLSEKNNEIQQHLDRMIKRQFTNYCNSSPDDDEDQDVVDGPQYVSSSERKLTQYNSKTTISNDDDDVPKTITMITCKAPTKDITTTIGVSGTKGEQQEEKCKSSHSSSSTVESRLLKESKDFHCATTTTTTTTKQPGAVAVGSNNNNVANNSYGDDDGNNEEDCSKDITPSNKKNHISWGDITTNDDDVSFYSTDDGPRHVRDDTFDDDKDCTARSSLTTDDDDNSDNNNNNKSAKNSCNILLPIRVGANKESETGGADTMLLKNIDRSDSGPQYVGGSDDDSLEDDDVEEEDNDITTHQRRDSGPQYVGIDDIIEEEEKAEEGFTNNNVSTFVLEVSRNDSSLITAEIVPNDVDIEATFQARLSQERECIENQVQQRMIGEAVMAEEVDNVEVIRKRTRERIMILIFVILAILGTVIGLSVGLTGNKDDDDDVIADVDDVIAIVPQTICYDRFPGQNHERGQLCGPEETKEHGGGACNVVAKAFLEHTLTADFCILNAGLVASDIAEGGFTRGDAESLFGAFNRSTLETVEMMGKEIVQVLNEALDFGLNVNSGAYPYGSGIRYDVIVNASVIGNIEINPRLEGRWTPIDFDERYTVVTTTSLAEGNDGYVTFLSIPEMHFDTKVQTAKAFVEFADKTGVIEDLPTTEYSTQYYGAIARPTSLHGITLQAITEEGVLRCGVHDERGLALSHKSDTGNYEGFEIDLCKAVAAAIFGDPRRVKFITINGGEERFDALTEKSVDLLVAQATHTMERDIYKKTTGEGYTFSAPYLYDGLGFGGVPPFGECANNLDNLFGECHRLKICVLEESTHYDFLFTVFPQSNIVPLPYASFYEKLADNLVKKKCNAIAGERFDISEDTLRKANYTGSYEVFGKSFSKEPLAMVTREEDVQWSDFVNSVFHSLLVAEKQNITQNNAHEFATTTLFGKEYENMFIRAIGAVGNYGELYKRHLESVIPRQPIDFINVNGTSGLLYYHPFGDITATGPGPVVGGTLERIVDRGHLRCGISAGGGFGELDKSTNVWRGLDADYCRAISASIFAGHSSKRRRRNKKSAESLAQKAVDDWTVFVEHNNTGDGFISLANGGVDVLSGGGWNFQSEVMRPAAGEGFTFSQVYFYNTSLNSLDGDKGSAYGYTRALVTRQDDSQWSDFVYFIVGATFYADEHVITQQIANEEMPKVNLFGADFEHMLQNAISAVGNYKEMYERNVEAVLGTIRRGRNLLNVQPFGPQHFPIPGL